MPHITLLVLEQALASSLTLSTEMLRAADQFHQRRWRHRPRLRIACCSASRQRQVTTAGGLVLRTDAALPGPGQTDLVIVPALWRNPERALRHYPALPAWLKLQQAAGTRICAVGSGSSFLAISGLLDRRPATTHWHDFERFAQQYPHVHLQRRHLITRSGNLYCAASINAVADLMIHFVQEFYDMATAREVESHFSPEIRSPYQQQLYNQEAPSVHHDELMARAQDWLRQHLAERIVLESLAASLGLSTRTLARRFRAATGQTPQAYLHRLRIDTARDLLRHSNLNISEIAWQCGFSSPGHFTARFRQIMHRTPSAYREAVRGKLFSADPTTDS